MTLRLDYFSTAPDLFKPMLAMEDAIKGSGLEHSLIELVKLRVSQINGCAYCIHMHTHVARANGESEDRMYLLNAWHESSLYTDRERAALGWAEALTRIETKGAPLVDYNAMADQFEARDQVALMLVISTINAWNRIAIGFATPHPVAQEADAA